MLDEYSTVSVVVIDTVVNALLYILSGLFYNKRRIHYRRSICFLLHIEQAEEHIYKFSGIDEGNIPRL